MCNIMLVARRNLYYLREGCYSRDDDAEDIEWDYSQLAIRGLWSGLQSYLL